MGIEKLRRKIDNLRYWWRQVLYISTCRWIIWLAGSDCVYVVRARRELPVAEDADDTLQVRMNEHVLSVLALFSLEGHSGSSASYAIAQIERLLRFRPLSALTGEADEWGDSMEGELRQNKRASNVFLDVASGQAYLDDGFVFRSPDGFRFIAFYSRMDIQFPHVIEGPVTINVPTNDPTHEEMRRAVLDAGYQVRKDRPKFSS